MFDRATLDHEGHDLLYLIEVFRVGKNFSKKAEECCEEWKLAGKWFYRRNVYLVFVNRRVGCMCPKDDCRTRTWNLYIHEYHMVHYK